MRNYNLGAKLKSFLPKLVLVIVLSHQQEKANQESPTSKTMNLENIFNQWILGSHPNHAVGNSPT